MHNNTGAWPRLRVLLVAAFVVALAASFAPICNSLAIVRTHHRVHTIDVETNDEEVVTTMTELKINNFRIEDPEHFELPEAWLKAVSLSLDNAGLTEIPRAFGRLTHIQTLTLTHNEIPDYRTLQYLAELPNLRTLDMRHNPVERLRFNHATIVRSMLPNLVFFNGQQLRPFDA